MFLVQYEIAQSYFKFYNACRQHGHPSCLSAPSLLLTTLTGLHMACLLKTTQALIYWRHIL